MYQKCNFMFSWRSWSDIQYQISIPCGVWKNSDPIFKMSKNFQFMFSWSSWSYIQDLQESGIHFLWRYCSRIQDFQEFIRRIVRICRAPSFPKFQNVGHSVLRDFQKYDFPRIDSRLSCICCCLFVFLKLKIIRFGHHGHVEKQTIITSITFLVFPEWNRKDISPKWGAIILRSFRATPLFLKFTIEMVPQTTNPELSLIRLRLHK